MADSPPLTPDGTTARRWLSDELAKPDYQDRLSLTERLMRWLAEHFGGGTSVGGVSVPGWLIALVLLAALAAVFVVSWRRHRPAARVETDAAGRSDTVFADMRLDVGGYLQQVRQLRGHDDARALLAAYRALVVRCEELGMLHVEDATTVGDVTAAMGEQLSHRGIEQPAFGVADAGRAFEGVRYGNRNPTAAQIDAVLALEALVRAQPTTPQPVP